MKRYLIMGAVFLFSISCFQKGSSRETKQKDTTKKKMETFLKDGDKCIREFRKLRDCIYQAKKDSVKQYFSFPLDGKGFWYLVWVSTGADNSSLLSKQDPFTEKDFDKYFNEIFFPQYLKCLLKVKSEDLFEKGFYSTVHFVEKENDGFLLEYWMNAVYDNKKKILRLMLNNYEYKGTVNSLEHRVGESLTEFDFRYDNDCNLIFDTLQIAG